MTKILLESTKKDLVLEKVIINFYLGADCQICSGLHIGNIFLNIENLRSDI